MNDNTPCSRVPEADGTSSPDDIANAAGASFVFPRTLDAETLVVALNRSDEAHSVRIPLPERLRGAYELVFATEQEGTRLQQDVDALGLEVPERTGLVVRRVSEPSP